jgi:hypothetical protein
MGVAAVAGAAAQGIAGSKAASAQKRAAQQAAALQGQATAENKALTQDLYNKNTGLAQDTYRQQLTDNSHAYDTARGALDTGFGTANQQVGQGYGQAIDTLSPFASTNSLMGLHDMMGIARPGEDQARPYSFQAQDPSYAWRFQQGQQAIDRSAASRGMLLSGAQLKGSQEFGQGMASQEYGNQFNRLSGLATNAQNAAGNVANMQQGRGTALANLATNQGTANANLATGQGTALNNLGQTNLSNLSTLNTNYGNTMNNLVQTGTGNVNQSNQDAAAAKASGYLTTGSAISKGIGGLSSIYGGMTATSPTQGGLYGYGQTATSQGPIDWTGPRPAGY